MSNMEDELVRKKINNYWFIELSTELLPTEIYRKVDPNLKLLIENNISIEIAEEIKGGIYLPVKFQLQWNGEFE